MYCFYGVFAAGDLREVAQRMLRENNPNDVTKMGVDWTTGLKDEELRWMAYNGAISSRQLQWLESTLAQAQDEKQKVLLFSHVPLFPAATQVPLFCFPKAVEA